MTGYTNARTLQTLNFTFTVVAGQALGQVTTDLSTSSRVWFESAASEAFGGQFTVEVPFTLQSGSAPSGSNLVANVRSIVVKSANEIGTSDTVEVLIQ